MSWLWGGKKTNKDHGNDDDGEDDSSYEDEEYSDEDGEEDENEEYSDEDDDEHDNNDDGGGQPHHSKRRDGQAPAVDQAKQKEKEQLVAAAAAAAETTEEKDPTSVTSTNEDACEGVAPAAAGEDTTEKQQTKVTASVAVPLTPVTKSSTGSRPDDDALDTAKRSNKSSSNRKKGATIQNNNSIDEDDDQEEEMVVTDEDVLVGNIPQNVTSNRPRFPSALSVEDVDDSDDDDHDSNDNDDDDAALLEDENRVKKNAIRISTAAAPAVVEEDFDFETVNVESSDDVSQKEDEPEDDDDDEEEAVTTTSIAEKQSLLVLAAEHDRVDILQALLNEAVAVPATPIKKDSPATNAAAPLANDNANTSINNNRTPQQEQRHVLLHGGIPPLHIAIKHGSINATNCLLRMGADPSIRPNAQALSASSSNTSTTTTTTTPAVLLPKDLNNVSAWELAFGARPVSMPPSKREGIRHAFTAEALRCIGSDEVHRLQQLLDAGMPADMEMGGKNLFDWAVDMQGVLCQKALRPQQHESESSSSTRIENGKDDAVGKDKTKASSAVLDRPSGQETFAQLVNRFDELENLARALSTCLDNLAEEVSVCHGLLLMGGGATALASHVRSLKALKERKIEELTRLEESWENSQDELAYWVRECGGPEGEQIAAQITPVDMHLLLRRQSFLQPKHDDNDPSAPPISAEEREASRLRQLQAQIAASESKVRKLRVSIADLSEENARDLKEVENRGLTGGIHLVRGLRDEIREVEFAISEVKSAEAGCRAKISMIQTKVQQKQQSKNGSNNNNNKSTPSSSSPTGQTKPAAVNGSNATFTASVGKAGARVHGSSDAAVGAEGAGDSHTSNTMTHSERMATGQSTAIAIRTNVSGRGGYFTIGLWQIIMRIIGIGASDVLSASAPRSGNRSYSRSSSTGTAHSSAQPAMIV